jgi:Cation transporting ATPase, C-terminus
MTYQVPPLGTLSSLRQNLAHPAHLPPAGIATRGSSPGCEPGSRRLPLTGRAGLAPFTAAQILFFNLVMDGPPALSLGVDPPGAT